LPRVVKAVKGQTEIWFDGGIRSGQDILRALALGANTTMIGRAFLYGLGAAGQAGVEHALEIMRNELSTTMGLCGKRSLNEVDRDILLNPNCFEHDYSE